ncbi:MAG: WbqC family protein [Bacteroidota bacterium]
MKPAATSLIIDLHYLPSVHYFAKLIQYPKVRIEQYENYSKGSYRNRAVIASTQGPLRLSIPLRKGKNERQAIRDVQIAYDQPWPSQHWTAIRSAYGNSPYFEHYADYLQPLFQNKTASLFDFNLQLLHRLIQLLQIEVDLGFTDAYHKSYPEEVADFRHLISPKHVPSNVDPHFSPSPYAQVFQEKTGFLPNLSVIDLLFCTGPASHSLLELSIKT